MAEEPKETLPAGHAQAGYNAPDLSFHEGTGTIPDVEKQWHEARNKQQQETAEAVAEHEDKVAKAERKEAEQAEAEAAKAEEPAPKAAAKK
ncbi:MAG TPA: hypothetical protein VKD72_25705 [Gemmataceae bacterium]|nr:hypothetical protein [Gemmataceae bacterium]